MDEVQIKLAAEQHTLAVFGLEKTAITAGIVKMFPKFFAGAAGPSATQMVGRLGGLAGGLRGAAGGALVGGAAGAMNAQEGDRFAGALRGAGVGAALGGAGGAYMGRNIARQGYESLLRGPGGGGISRGVQNLRSNILNMGG